MNREHLWALFAETGDIYYYLMYKAKEAEDAASENAKQAG